MHQLITQNGISFTFSHIAGRFYHVENLNKRRAEAAQTARSRCKRRYALFRDYRHTRASRLLEPELVDSSIKTVIRAT